jgi:glutamate-ammonia-ligase adenylyltransferase
MSQSTMLDTNIRSLQLPEAIREQLLSSLAQYPNEWSVLLSQQSLLSSMRKVFSASDFVLRLCTRQPQLLLELVTGDWIEQASTDAWMHDDLQARAAGGDAAQWPDLLRVFRKRHMLRIAWRDIAGKATLDQTLHDLSLLADVCIRFACERMTSALVERYGVPRAESDGQAQTLVTLGMGKLGGRELNFSSDIDLVLLYPEEGQTDGNRPIDNTEFFLRLGQKMVQLLADTTAEGFVYRVDLRLRPFGDSGRLALSFAAFENYLQQHGRDWERYAYVKARAITGEEHFPALYNDVLRPFVYRRYLDFGVFESLRDMKAMIAREVERRDLQDNVKLGPGGIREIEFIVQALQLIRGGQDRRLQTRELRTALLLMVGKRLLRADIVSQLDSAYRFLRITENRLQEWNDEQTHQLPVDAAARARLAESMDFADWDSFAAQLDQHRRQVAEHFAQTVFGPAADAGGAAPALDLDASVEDGIATLRALGFAVPPPLQASLETLAGSTYFRRLDATGRRRLGELLPRMLGLIASSPLAQAGAVVTFGRLTKILEMIAGRTAYLALLNENAAALLRLVELCAQSQFLADQIAAHPLLLDELIDERLVDEPPTRARFEVDLAARRHEMQGEDPERQVETLRQFQRAAVFRIAVADLSGQLPLMKVSDRLTDIAELIVKEALALAWAQITARHGVPMCEAPNGASRTPGMIVVAYGKLGGLELGYGSDLDLVFLHDSEGEGQRTAGEQAIENTVFFQRLGQRLVHLLTVYTSAGRLYEVDTRLRPGGNRGLLVQTMLSFRDYEFQEAWTWEHQSLLRARAVVGDAALKARFEEARVEVLRNAVRRDDLKREVRNMRRRMRDNLSKAKAGQFDIKQDAGGVADLEFLVQYWMLKWADRYPQIVIFSDNIRQLESLASGNLVPQSQVDFLVDTYRKYRARLHHLSLDGAGNVVDVSEFAAERAGVVAIWDEILGADSDEQDGPADA